MLRFFSFVNSTVIKFSFRGITGQKIFNTFLRNVLIQTAAPQTSQEHFLWVILRKCSLSFLSARKNNLPRISRSSYSVSHLHCAAGVNRYHVLIFERKDRRVPFTSLVPQSWLQNEEGRPILPSSYSSRKATMVAKRQGKGGRGLGKGR